MSRALCGQKSGGSQEVQAPMVTKRKDDGTVVKTHIKTASKIVGNVVDEIVYCMQANITEGERNKKLGFALHDLGQVERCHDKALNPNGIFADSEENEDEK